MIWRLKGDEAEGGLVDEQGSGGGTGQHWKDMAKKIEDLQRRFVEHLEGENDQRAKGPPIIKAPGQPTKEQWNQHRATHIPCEAWCPHCVAARAVRRDHPTKKNRAHIIPGIDDSDEGPMTTSMDYMYLHGRVGRYKEEKLNSPYLVAVEHRHGRCWAYQVPNKGHLEGAHWPPKRLLQDWYDCGPKGTRIILKSDQEPTMTNVQPIVQALGPNGVVPINRPVGGSECNGRVEDTIRRVQEKIRAFRHALDQGTREKVHENPPIMAWLVRWPAELLSKYYIGDDGIKFYETTRGNPCKTQLAPFGETSMHLHMKTVRRSKGETIKIQGIWLGIHKRTEETFVGTTRGVAKCRTIIRLSNDQYLDRRTVVQMKGAPVGPNAWKSRNTNTSGDP